MLRRSAGRLALLAIVLVLALTASACGGDGDEPQAPTGETSTGETPVGGTLKIALLSDVQEAFDPQKEYYSIAWEFYRCCLLRTLLSYNGKTTSDGGADVLPDLATALPEVSADGLTWTFTLKPGIAYAPPLDDVTVSSQDFIRAMERAACGECSTGGYSFYYSAIEGFDEFVAGEADSISGLEAPDDTTLIIRTTAPTGDLPFRMAMPAAAPIPPHPDDPDAPFGVATGHDDNYGRFLIPTGPYMFEGTDQLDFSLPPDDQEPASGYDIGRSIVLVRNPSYDPDSDDLREGFVDRIEVQIGGDEADLANKVDVAEIDMVMDGVPPPTQITRYASDPNLEDQIHLDPSDAVRYIEMNLALPPFDDVNVRRAVNFALDKEGFRQLRGGPLFGELAGHIMVNSLQGNQLAEYDPYATPNGNGDIEAAKASMALSRYDADGDGVCDDSSCDGLLTFIDESSPYPEQTALLQESLQPIGISLEVRAFERTTMYANCEDPNSHWQLCPSVSWGKDYPDGFTFGPPLFSRDAIGPEACCNDPMVGATPDILRGRGYDPTTEIPSAEQQIEACIPLGGDERLSCWASLDRYLMEDVVPWVPYLFDNNVVVVSERVTAWSFDQFAGLPALDRIAILP
ncbi:MAG: ABC transporter substrate-binding protein [Actinobacteria bacterium]|nr:ABC transporter substrate-binding protein [Actinomycetota bacterium]